MGLSLAKKINRKIDRLLSYPGCDEKTLNMRKTLWLSALIGFVFMSLVAIAYQVSQPHEKYALFYGYYLTIALFLATLIEPLLKKYFSLYVMISTLITVLVTFYVILKQGGIKTEFSMLFANLGFVLLTIPLRRIWYTIGLFCLFAVLTLVVAFLGSSMKAPDQEMVNSEVLDIISVISIVFISALALFFIVIYMKKQQKLEETDAARQKELSNAKTKLFTNITHEFRTPLTVIGGMADLIKQKPELWVEEGADRIKDNSNVMLGLVNQLLDISKIEAKAMPINMIQEDIARYVGFVIELHRSAAIKKNIALTLTSNKNPVIMDFDPDIISRILSNLLSNAIKFTPEKGNVEVRIDTDNKEEFFTLQVIDSGKGIPEDKLPFIFDRFYQVENQANSEGGTGLGLALVKELTELISGSLTVNSHPGKGSAFKVTLPVTRNAKSGEQFFKTFYENKILQSTEDKKSLPKKVKKSKADLPVLLVVEDSKDVSVYLSGILSDEYNIEFAVNGKNGLETATEKIPDIVVSDIMMPEMDGIEMLDKLKTDFRTSHIPVVLLTAKADIDSRLEGLERGADAYITKPFNEKELHVQLRNLIETRKKLHERYAALNRFSETHDPELRTEDAFMLKVRGILEKNLDNDEFNINDLCREMAVSHTQFYRKFKSISNLTIADYLKLLRLERAKELLSTSEMNITQIAFATGFKNLSHFSREFSFQFGKSPTEIRKGTNSNLFQANQN